MGLAVLHSHALTGMEASEVTVEVHLANGLPTFTIVGLPDIEVRESKDCVRAALQNAGFEFPAQRITVNLAPADLPKESGRFDFIALRILAAAGELPSTTLGDYEFTGELSLSGELRPIHAALALTLAIHRSGGTTGKRHAFILPRANAAEAALVPEAVIFPADSLLQVCAHLASVSPEARLTRFSGSVDPVARLLADFAEVRGQGQARRPLEVAAAASHSVLMVGPPGAGKSMLVTRLPGILPPMSDDEALEAAAAQSLTGSFSMARWRQRPNRAPHHNASGVALVGGSSVSRLGEISLANHGVLFLDELPEFDRKVLEVLREQIESGRITISRAARQSDFPCRFQLIAAMNPCPCGYLGRPTRPCHCTPDGIARYRGKISGPLLDRIDLQIQVAVLRPEELVGCAPGEPSAAIAERVALARARQQSRQEKVNAHLSVTEIDALCKPDAAAEQLLRAAMTKLNWSARAYHRVLKVARIIADLQGENQICSEQNRLR